MKLILFFVILFTYFSSLGQTQVSINFIDYTGDTLFIGDESIKDRPIIDKLVRKSPGSKFVFTSKVSLGETVLYIQKPNDKKGYQFLYNPTDKDFDVMIENKDKLKIKFLHHDLNSTFYPELDKVVKYSYQTPDSLSNFKQLDSLLTILSGETLEKSIDSMLLIIADRPNAMKYFVNQLINLYSSSHIGFDKALIHLVDKYVTSGKYGFTPEEISNKTSQADDYRMLVGNPVLPDFTVFKENNEAITLHGINAPITILIFWSPTCNHCKKSLPYIVSFVEKYKSDDFKVLSVCDKGGDKVSTCWPFITENKMANLLNTADVNRNYNQSLRMRKVPKVFILDKNKKVILKDFNIHEIEKYYNYSKTKMGI